VGTRVDGCICQIPTATSTPATCHSTGYYSCSGSCSRGKRALLTEQGMAVSAKALRPPIPPTPRPTATPTPAVTPYYCPQSQKPDCPNEKCPKGSATPCCPDGQCFASCNYGSCSPFTKICDWACTGDSVNCQQSQCDTWTNWVCQADGATEIRTCSSPADCARVVQARQPCTAPQPTSPYPPAGPVDGLCSLPPVHNGCNAGTLGYTAEYSDKFQRWYKGTNGGANVLCTEWKPLPCPANFAVSCAGCALRVLIGVRHPNGECAPLFFPY